MRILLYLAFLSVLSLSCSRQWCYTRHPLSASVDTVKIENIKEIPVYIEGDTIEIIFPLDCPDTEVFEVENNRLKQQIQILNKELHSTVQAKPIHDTITVTETVMEIKEVRVTEPVRYTPKIYKQALTVCIIFVIGFIAWPPRWDSLGHSPQLKRASFIIFLTNYTPINISNYFFIKIDYK